MSLSAGVKLGAYEILGPLGAGGMGEVYRAKDAKLGREVAIKVLPAELSRDPERLARFEREARLLATLNHTNIAAIVRRCARSQRERWAEVLLDCTCSGLASTTVEARFFQQPPST
jgi:serine/threonine protein kinase